MRLEALDLGENLLKDVGVEYVSIVPCLRELKALWLDRCDVRLSGARLFAKKASFLNDLRLLELGHNHFGPAGLGALLQRGPKALHTLRMCDNDLLDEGVELLASSPASNGLLEVDLSQNRVRTAGEELGGTEHLRELLVLRLADNQISTASAAALAASPLGKRLAVLELGDLPGSAPAVPPPAPPAPLPPASGDDPLPF